MNTEVEELDDEGEELCVFRRLLVVKPKSCDSASFAFDFHVLCLNFPFSLLLPPTTCSVV